MAGPNRLTHYERMEATLNKMTPDPATFNTIYPLDEIRADQKLLQAVKSTPDYRIKGERADDKVLEVTFTTMVEAGDWFLEEERFAESENYSSLKTFPTAEIDDVFNHIDLVGMIQNDDTGGEVIPFAIDLTYCSVHEGMNKKLSWEHEYGKPGNTDKSQSEFGTITMKKKPNGEQYVRTYSLPESQRDGLKIPGFASAKYFEDTDNPWMPMHKKGRIPVMPRFVVGYSPDLADVLAQGSPTNEYYEKYGEREYLKKRKAYLTAEKRAKWCTLIECAEQAEQISQMVERLPESMTQIMNAKELAEAKKQIATMEKYFTGALEAARREAENSESERDAMNYAYGDKIRKVISSESEVVYNRPL